MASQPNRKLAQFTPQDLIITDRSLRTPYRQRSNENKTAIHWGQRKLLLSEVEFFTIYWNQKEIPNPLCVYAGAAPGTHITLLSEMFPALTFHLYDPADFDIKESDKIRLFKEYFTEDVARRYAERDDVFFVSDIRTADYKSLQHKALAKRGVTEFNNDGTPKASMAVIKEAYKEAEVTNEDQIWGDMNMQQNWVMAMNPEHALLKFRLPYVLDGNERMVQYLKGIVYWQVWAPQTSTETRLKPVRNSSGLYETADWNILEYEQWCFHHNTVSREQTFYQNPFTDNNDPIDYPELLNDFDSVAEATILRMYLVKLGVSDVYTQVKRLSRLITLSINHYRVDTKGAKSLSSKRSSPVKSSSKSALDAFRNKRTGRPVRHTAFQHTKVALNPSWRQDTPVSSGRVQASPAPPVSSNVSLKGPVSSPNISTQRSPVIVPSPMRPIISPVVSPTASVQQSSISVPISPLRPVATPTLFGQRSPAIIPARITPPVASPTVSGQRSPGIIPPHITPPVASPTVSGQRSPSIIPPSITPPVASPTVSGQRSPTVVPTRIVPPVASPSVSQGANMPTLPPMSASRQ